MTQFYRFDRALMVGLLLCLLPACSESFDPWHQDSSTGRWFTPEQVSLGAQVYRDNCAACHGDQAESTPLWIKPDADGFYPPPPLNGTAHAWHHPFPMLKKTIMEGTQGKMPGWRGKLSEQEVEAVIAWFQSLWPDEGYQIWQRRHKH